MDIGIFGSATVTQTLAGRLLGLWGTTGTGLLNVRVVRAGGVAPS